MTDEERSKKITRRELFSSLRPGGLRERAQQVRSRLATGLDDYVEENRPRIGYADAGSSSGSSDDPPEALPGRALEAISRDYPDEAIAALRPYVKHKPKDREARLLLGRVLYKDGAIVQSRVEFERIVRDSSVDSLSRWPASCAALWLACALARCGKLEKAAATLRQAADEDRPQAAATVERLAQALDKFAAQDEAEDASLDAAVDGLVTTLENYIEAAYPSQMEMAADLVSGEAPRESNNSEASAT